MPSKTKPTTTPIIDIGLSLSTKIALKQDLVGRSIPYAIQEIVERFKVLDLKDVDGSDFAAMVDILNDHVKDLAKLDDVDTGTDWQYFDLTDEFWDFKDK